MGWTSTKSYPYFGRLLLCPSVPLLWYCKYRNGPSHTNPPNPNFQSMVLTNTETSSFSEPTLHTLATSPSVPPPKHSASSSTLAHLIFGSLQPPVLLAMQTLHDSILPSLPPSLDHKLNPAKPKSIFTMAPDKWRVSSRSIPSPWVALRIANKQCWLLLRCPLACSMVRRRVLWVWRSKPWRRRNRHRFGKCC